MQKLTKEQADWLIERFRTDTSLGQALLRSDIIDLIKECTEKEFPKIFMRPIHAEHEEEIRVFEAMCDTFDDCISVYSKQEYTHLRPEQFKKFTEGCNKIVEWLNAETN